MHHVVASTQFVRAIVDHNEGLFAGGLRAVLLERGGQVSRGFLGGLGAGQGGGQRLFNGLDVEHNSFLSLEQRRVFHTFKCAI